jgi:predicted DCC family thiol-disulfide oxidoreductase YuxK
MTLPLSYDGCRQSQTYVKPEAVITVFELLMMSGVSLETYSAIKKHWNNKFYYTVAFFGYFYTICIMIHG